MDDPFSRPGPERSFPCPRSAVCIIVTNASRPDHPGSDSINVLSVATWTLPASACPLHRFAGTIRRNKHRDDRAHGRLQNPLAQNDVRAAEPSRRWEARWNKWKGHLIRDRDGAYGQSFRSTRDGDGRGRGRYGATEPVAKSVCGTPDRQREARMPGPFDHPQRAAFAAHSWLIPRQLSRFENPLVARQGHPGWTTRSAGRVRNGRFLAQGRRSASSLRTPRGLTTPARIRSISSLWQRGRCRHPHALA